MPDMTGWIIMSERDSGDFLKQAEVTAPTLKDVVERAYLDARIDEDGDLVVTVSGRRVVVTVKERSALVRMWMIFGLKPGATDTELLNFLTELNSYQMVRFTVDEDRDTLYIDYYSSFAPELSKRQFVQSLHRFVDFAETAMRNEDGHVKFLV